MMEASGKEASDGNEHKQSYLDIHQSFASGQRVAGNLKNGLESYYRLATFVAHDDIDVSAIWRNEIENALRKCVAVVVLLSDSFVRSTWGNQEMGFASALNKTIIPFKLEGDVDPYGFDKFQAKRLEPENITKSVRSIIEVLVRNNEFPTDGFVKLFAKSLSYIEATVRSQQLGILHLTDEQISKIVSAATSDDQIYRSFGAQNALRKFFNKQRARLDEKDIEKLKEST